MANKDTIAIVAVASVVAAAILAILVVRLVKKIAATSNPLPPVQPLAHHREHQLAKFENTLPRSQTWYNSQTHLVAPDTMSARASRASLLSKNSPTVSSPGETESATLYSPMNYDHALPVPSPPFHPARPGSSSSSHVSSEQASPSSSQTPSATDHNPMPKSVSSPRPISVSSSHSTLYSKASRHTLRGTPHGPHSQIQIVLPMPLSANDLSRSASGDLRRASRIDGEVYDRSSVADRWLSPGTPSEGSPRRGSSSQNGIPAVPRVPSMYALTEMGEKRES
ncbi:hypothetical protein CPC08DRAFT_701651 [Agrocybe pediades]|nr:hypothetical protein CPC08DRAFT_701651 [Agrocybe pediades]